MPSLVRRNSRSALRSPLKSATAARIQSVPTAPSNCADAICKPFIRYCDSSPSLSRRNRRSSRPSPLKSPNCDANVHVAGGGGGGGGGGGVWMKTHAAPTLALSAFPPTMAVLPSADSAADKPWAAAPEAPLPTSLAPCCVHTPPLRVNTHAAPKLILSLRPPTMAALPSPDSATAKPCAAAPAAPLPISLAPCCIHTPPLRVNAHVAPMPPLSPGPPSTAVSPSSDSATERPCWAPPTAPLPISLAPCWVQTPPLRVNTHAAPRLLLSALPPTMAVLPLSDSATESPWKMKDPTPPVPTSFGPCCVQTPPLRVNTHAAPTKPLSLFPPTMAVLPSPDSATEAPWLANPPPTPPPTSFGPSCVHTPPLRVKTHAAPMKPLSPTPPTMAVLPSADSATEVPCMAGAVPTVPLPTSFGPCCIHAPPLRVKTQAAPAPPLSLPPPTMAVLPSADSATERPW